MALLVPYDPKLEGRPSWNIKPGGQDYMIIWLRCPNGHIGCISEHNTGEDEYGHDINEDGIVTPSIVCPHEGCNFHEMIQLDQWYG